VPTLSRSARCFRFHYDEDRPKENFPIGDSVVKLEPLGLTEKPTQFQFKLVSPRDGQTHGEVSSV
jgi:hypothetical protein